MYFMWLVYSLLASFIYGFEYVVAEKLLKHVSSLTLLFIELLFSTVAIGILAVYSGSYTKDLPRLMSADNLPWLVLGILSFGSAIVLTAFSIQAKNATLASLVEISYPLFVILATYIFLHKSHLSPEVVLGGALIFTGVAIISVFGN